MEFRILGPLEVVEDGHRIPLGGPKQRTVLAHLVLRPNRIVSAELLIDEVWGDDPPPAARKSLQSYVSHLRNALGDDRLEGRSGGYILHVASEEIDASRFEALAEEARRLVATDAAGTVHACETAMALWRGRVLDDLSDQASLRPEIARLEEVRLAMTEDRIAAELSLGRRGELVPELQNLTGRHPFRERLWGQLMVALYRSGRQADALKAYGRTRDVLSEELGLDPSPDLQRLQEQILRQDPALDIRGEPLRGYRLLEPVGQGTFGEVHRAFQPEVGREVAVKIIRPGLANHPEFIRRFDAEAQLVARVEHPHIVPLYDFWREPGGAYLVMRYLRGGSLREALAHGPLEVDRAVRLIDQVALALSAAHRQGVIHRDVQPANILFDEEGNAYLSDFGVAKDLAVAVAAGRDGTPTSLAYYASPEGARGEAVSPRADLYSLGVVLFESLAGQHPFADTPPDRLLEKHAREPLPSLRSLRPELPEAIEEVIARATAKTPDERHPDALALAAAVREALAPTLRPAPRATVEARNPYKGLRPFLEADADDYFGREALVDELVARMAERGAGSRFLALIGPSGSGKSSLVRAGLVPALRQGRVRGSERWFVVEMHPGAHPFEELAACLTRIAVDPAPGLAERLRDASGLLRAAGEVLPAGSSELLLVIDQFEELFTLVPDEQLRTAFVAALHTAVTDPGSRVRVVVTLRADFYDRPLSDPRLAELVKTRAVTVTPLLPEELERAVSGPAERVGVTVDLSVVAEIAAEVAAQPGALPLLQYALTELFDSRRGGAVTLEDYRGIGGVSGALVRRAEDLYGRLDHAGKQATRQLFLRLVTLGQEGSEDTRRRALRAELTSLEADPRAMEAAIDAFGVHRLLSFDRDPVTRGPTVEVAHEALLREWGRLRGWIEAAREDVRFHRRLATAAREWADSGRDPGYLLRGVRLARSETWAATSRLALTTEERAYLEAGIALRDAEREQEEARAGRERALERRSLVRLRALVSVFAVAALVAGGLTVFAFSERGRAEREARTATARELAAAAIANLDLDPERSILLALAAVDATREADGRVLGEAEEALHRAVRTSRVVYSVPHGGWGLGVGADGAVFATGGSDEDDSTATIWDLATGERRRVLTGPDVGWLGVAVSPDSRLVATTHKDGTGRLWDAATGQELHTLRGHQGPATQPAFSPDGRWLATGGDDATVRVWDVAAGLEQMMLTGHDGPTIDIAFSPDGSRLASASLDATARVWDLTTRETLATLEGHEWAVTGIDFSPDGTDVVTASGDGSVRIWDAGSGAQLRTFIAHVDLNEVDYSPDGTSVASVGADGIARIWDAETGRELTLAGHTGRLANVSFTPDGDHLLTAGTDGTTRLWDLSVGGGRDWLTVPAAELIFVGVAFSPDGTRFAAPAEPSGVTIWDAQTGEELVTLTGYEPKLTAVAFSPDGSRIAAASDLSRAPPVWDVATGQLLFTLDGHEDYTRAVAFSPDGASLVTGSWDGTARVWDASTGEERGVLPAGREILSAGFSPDGRTIVTGEGGGGATVWDAVTFDRVRILSGHTGTVTGLAFGPDGMVATASEDGTARVWDLGSGEERAIFRGHTAPVHQVAVSPDGRRIATGSGDGTGKLWDPTTGREQFTLFGHDSFVFGVDFSPDGRLLATGSPDGTVALYLLPIDEFRELARARVTRGLTDDECRRYLHVGTCP